MKSESRTPGILKKEKGKTSQAGGEYKPKFDYRNLKKAKSPEDEDADSPYKSRSGHTEKRRSRKSPKHSKTSKSDKYDDDSASDGDRAQDSASSAER